MALQAIADPAGRIKLFGDVAFLFAVAIVLAAVMPPGLFAEQAFGGSFARARSANR